MRKKRKKKNRPKPTTDYPTEFITPLELAKFLGFDRRTIYDKVENKEIPAVRIFGRWRFRKDDIEKWLKSHYNMKKKGAKRWKRKKQS